MITFQTQPIKTIENAYNNQVYRFTGDSSKTAVRCEWTIFKGSGIFRQGEITSNLNSFYFNAKSPITSLFNQNNFVDNILPEVSNFLKLDATLYDELSFLFKVIYNDGTNEEVEFDKEYLKSVESLLRPLEVENTVFKPLIENNYFNYWEGVPFDISFFSDSQRDVNIINTSTGVSSEFTFQKGVNRLFLSSGDTFTAGFENQIPLLTDQINVLDFIDVSTSNSLVTLQVKKHKFCQAPYLKWFNRKGGWSYFQFERVFQENTSFTNKEFLDNDIENLQETRSNFQTTGKESELSQRYLTPSLNLDEQENFIDIYGSPKVYYYNGVRNQPMELTNWKEVSIDNSTEETLNTKILNKSFEVNIELPNVYNQTYAR